MKNRLLKGIVVILSLTFLAGCGSREDEPEPEPLMLADHAVPVTIDGEDVIVGQTTLQPLVDAGFPISLAEWDGEHVTEHEIDPNEILTAGTSLTELSFWLTDSAFIRLSIEAANEDMRLGDAVISRLALHLSHQADTLPDNLMVNGVAITELSREKAGELFPDFEQAELSVTQHGEDYRCTLMFSPRTHVMYQFTLMEAEKEESILPPDNVW